MAQATSHVLRQGAKPQFKHWCHLTTMSLDKLACEHCLCRRWSYDFSKTIVQWHQCLNFLDPPLITMLCARTLAWSSRSSSRLAVCAAYVIRWLCQSMHPSPGHHSHLLGRTHADADAVEHAHKTYGCAFSLVTTRTDRSASQVTLAFHPSSKFGFALLPSRKVVSLVCHYKTGVTC